MNTLLRRILVALDPSPYSEAAIKLAGKITIGHDARLVGISVLDSPEIRSMIVPSQYSYWPMFDEAYQLQRKHAEERLEEVEDKFKKYCDDQNIPCSVGEEEGVPASLLLEAATLFDLLVIGLRTSFHFETRKEEGELLDRILKKSSTPILAVVQEPMPLKKVLITYDGGPAAARALRDFVVFAEPLDLEVDLFLADEDVGRREFHANKATHYLSACGHEVGQVIHYSGKALHALQDGVIDGYDLIVCGTHSKTKIRDTFVGSFTRKLIEMEAQCLFLSH